MKHLKIVSVLLSAAITSSMIVSPVGVIADEVPETSETQTVETSIETEQKESEKKKPAEAKAPEETTETVVETTKEEKETEPSEETKPSESAVPSESSETTPSESVPSETEQTVPEETVPSETETPSSEPVPESEDKKPARNEELPVSGKCGKSLTWRVMDKGQYGCYLYIDGSGDMYNYSSADQAPWSQYGTNLKYLILSDDVTSIGNYAFSEKGFRSFSASPKLKKIGDHAFENCNSLISVELNSVLVSVGTAAFNNCSSITQIELPNTVTSVGPYAFAGLSKLYEILIPGGVKTLADNAFANCSKLAKVTFLKGVTTINCAFPGCTKINILTIPTTVTKFKESAFADLADFPEVYYGGTQDQWKKIVIGNNNDKITGAPKHWSSGIASGTLGSNFTWTLDNNGKLTISGSGKMPSEQKYGWVSFKDYITSVVIEENITSIGIAAFDTCKALKSVTIPESVTIIDTAAFINCTSLTGITIPDSVKAINGEAFEGCKSLKNIVIPDSVTFLGSSVFRNCSGLTAITLSNGLREIKNGTFYGCAGLTRVVIHDGVTVIGQRAFQCCTNLKTISFTKSIRKVDEDAFLGVNNMTDITFDGTASDWNSINFDPGVSQITDATVTMTDGTVIPGRKKANTLKVSGKTAKLKYRKLRKKARTVSRSKAIKISYPQGTLSYSIISVSKSKYKKYFKINASTGKITVKKKLKKGTYKIKCAVSASGNNDYWKTTKNVTFKIKVK